jgi:PAS domain S-box-containing protein
MSQPVDNPKGPMTSEGRSQRNLPDEHATEALESVSEQELRAGEARFRRYFELGLIGMAITSPTKGMVEVNDHICEILGYERDELLRLTWAELTHPEDLARDAANFDRVLAGEIDGYSMDKRWIRKDGEVVDATISVKCRRGPDGTVDEFVALLQDITERKRAERVLATAQSDLARLVVERTAQLTAANERVKMILDSITDRFFAFDHDWRVTDFNRHGAAQLMALGKDPESFIGKVLWNEFGEPIPEEVFRHAMRDRVPVIHEHYYAPLGEWVENRIFPTMDGGLAIFQSYVTDRKLAEQKLGEGERRFRLLAESIPHHVWSFHHDGSVDYANQRLIDYTGLSAEELRRGGAWAALHPDDVAHVKAAWEEAWAHGTAYEQQQRMRGRDGRYRRFVCRGVPVTDEQGRPVEWFGTDTDVEDRRQAEEERVQLMRRLMAAQEEERRRLSREMHDQFGQQLTALSLKLATLRHECRAHPALSDQVESLEAIARQLDSDVGSIVWSLRPTALDDRGLSVALSNFVASWSKRFGVHAELHSNGMDKDRLEDDVETVLYRMVQEALTNVAKHAGAGNVAILLERRPDHVRLIVEDDGNGFDAERAFGAGEKGFGLVGMRERATLVGGTLGVESHPGEGTTVVVQIPLADRPNGADRG